MLLCWLIKSSYCINNFYVYLNDLKLYTFINNCINERFEIKIELNDKKLDLFNLNEQNQYKQNLNYAEIPFDLRDYQMHVFEGVNNINGKTIIKITLHDTIENKIVHIYKCYVDKDCVNKYIMINDHLLIFKHFQTELQKLISEFKKITFLFSMCKESFINTYKDLTNSISTVYNDVINCNNDIKIKNKEVKNKIENYKKNSKLNNHNDQSIDHFVYFIGIMKKKTIELQKTILKMNLKIPLNLRLLNDEDDYNLDVSTSELKGIQLEHFIIGSISFFVLCVVILWITKKR